MKKYFIIGAIVLLAGIIGWLLFSLKSTKKELQLARIELAVQNDTIESFRTKDSTLVSRLNSIEIDKSALKQSLEELGFTAKQLRDEKIKWQSIASVLQVKLETSGHGETHIIDTVYLHKTDTIRVSKFNWSNKFLFLNGNIEKKDMQFDYLYQTRINNIQSKNRKGTTVSLVLSDPKAKITNGASFTVIHQKSFLEKWWVTIPIGIAGGVLLAK